MIASRDEVANFSLEIEKISKDKGLSYMDAVIWYCEKFDFDFEIAAKLISGTLKCKIKIEAEDLHFLPKSNTDKLPI
jgi:hypothetical protein